MITKNSFDFFKQILYCLSSGINILAGGRPVTPEILPASDLPSPVNGILWEMSELITQERIAVGSSNLVEGLTT